MKMSEKDIIEKAKKGNNKAFSELYETHVTRLYRFMKQCGSRYSNDEIEDIVQRAFVKAFTKIDTFEHTSSFATWLFRIAMNELRSDMRRVPFVALETIADELYDYEDEHADEFVWTMAMKEMLNEVSDIKKSVFILYEVEGYSHAEIGQILGMEESSSRSLLTRTKQFLRKRWILSKEIDL